MRMCGSHTLRSGWVCGKKARQLFCVDWDSLVETDIEVVRKNLKVEVGNFDFIDKLIKTIN